MDPMLDSRRAKFPPGREVIARKRDFPSTTQYVQFVGTVTHAGTSLGKYMVEVADANGEGHIVALSFLEQANP